MISVEIYTLQDGHDTVAGTLTWDGEEIVCDPADSPLLQGVAKLGSGEEFLQNLCFECRSPYLRASAAKEIEKKTEGQPSR